MSYTNLTGIDISLAVWLVHDPYDFVATDKSISATGLMRPTRQIVLARRRDQMIQRGELPQPEVDITALIAASYGHAIHDAVEKAWLEGHREALAALGNPKHVIDRIFINPDPREIALEPDIIPIYIEQRVEKQIKGFTVSGKLDFCVDGRLKDTKSTGVQTYLKGRKDQDYSRQMSIYRWLDPMKITDDEADINFVFTDWQRSMTFGNSNYPSQRVSKPYAVPLHSVTETHQWISKKLDEILKYENVPETQLPRCTDEELWRSEPVWRYYSKTENKKATKKFEGPNAEAEAKIHLSSMGGKGLVKETPGRVKACSYCAAFSLCSQKDEYEHD